MPPPPLLLHDLRGCGSVLGHSMLLHSLRRCSGLGHSWAPAAAAASRARWGQLRCMARGGKGKGGREKEEGGLGWGVGMLCVSVVGWGGGAADDFLCGLAGGVSQGGTGQVAHPCTRTSCCCGRGRWCCVVLGAQAALQPQQLWLEVVAGARWLPPGVPPCCWGTGSCYWGGVTRAQGGGGGRIWAGWGATGVAGGAGRELLGSAAVGGVI